MDPTVTTSAPPLSASSRYDILDSPPEEGFDRLAEVAAFLFDAPIALVSLIDLDADRQWFKACIGLGARETGLDVSFCIHAVRSEQTLVVEDATEDSRFADNPLVTGEAGIRFYAGAPLVTPNGTAVGTLCVIDTEPRSPTDGQIQQLERLAATVVDELELRREATRRHRAEEQVRRIVEHAQPIVFMVDANGTLLLSEGRDLEGLGLQSGEAVGQSIHDLYAEHPQVLHGIEQALNGATVEQTVQIGDHVFEVSCAPYCDEEGNVCGCLGMASDVTQEAEARQHLKENEMQMRALANSVPGVIYDFYPNGNGGYTSNFIGAQAEPLLGISPDPEETFFERFVCRIPDAHRGSFIGSVQEAVESVEPWDMTFPFVKPDGTEIWLRGRSAPVREANGSHRFHGVLLDMTDHVHAKTRLRRVKNEYETVLNNAQDAIFFVDVEADDAGNRRFPFSWLNAAHEAQTGLSTAEVQGRTPRDILGDEVGAEVDANYRRCVESGQTIEYEETLPLPEGSRTWLTKLSPVMVDDTVEHIVGIARNITERKTAERELRDRMAQIRGLANSVPGVIFEFVAEPVPEGVSSYGLRFVSEQSASLLGIDPAGDRIFEQFAARIPPSHRDTFFESVRTAIREEAPWNLEVPFEPPDGGTIWIHGTATPEVRPGEIVFHGVLLEVTARKRLEAELRQAQKMETVGTLAGGVAHDFNNILHATDAYLDLLADGMEAGDPDHDILKRAKGGLERAGDLVDQLLTFSRQEKKVVERSVRVPEVVEDTLTLAEPSLLSTIRVRKQLPSRGCAVVGDPAQLRQAVMNLVTNAAQAMTETAAPRDGTAREPSVDPGPDHQVGESPRNVLDISVQTTHVAPDLAGQHADLTPGHYVRLAVGDTGSGMDAQTKERIFEPFFTTKDVGKGTGLGLSVVHGVVKAHNGAITIFSEPGEGTTIQIYLPAAPEEADARASHESFREASHSPSAHRISEPASLSVLLVDDEESVRRLERVRLAQLGHEVTAEKTASGVLRRMDESSKGYDVLVTDYLMPDMNGGELVRSLRERGHEIPIIVMSGFSAQVSTSEVKAAGANAFLQKPVGTHELDHAVRRVAGADDQFVERRGS